jgi:hypothetical protein
MLAFGAGGIVGPGFDHGVVDRQAVAVVEDAADGDCGGAAGSTELQASRAHCQASCENGPMVWDGVTGKVMSDSP